MKCTIPGANVKVLARAILALSRIGDELYVEPDTDRLSFRSVNSSRSAYASFTFGRPFFAYYRSDRLEGQRPSQDEDMKCKISMKSCLPVFRAPGMLERQVETCLLRLEADGSRLVLEMRCRHGVVKTHYMPIIECETLQVVYTTDASANRLTAHARLYSDAVLNFQAGQEEVTLAVAPGKTYLRSYSDNTLDPSKVIHTELCLEPGEFDRYTVPCEAAITFCLKEFRALLAFADATSLPVEVNFETAGRPVVFVVSNKPAFEANFVLATLSPELDSQSSTPLQQRRQSPTKRPSVPAATANGTQDTNQGTPGPSSEQIFENASVLFGSVSLRVRESDGEDDSVPGTPPPRPNKRARFLFKRCFEATFNPACIPGHDIVLAEDSADEGNS